MMYACMMREKENERKRMHVCAKERTEGREKERILAIVERSLNCPRFTM